MKIIAMVDNNWAIGNKGNILVDIPENQKFLHHNTIGEVIVYGRKSLSRFPNNVPLPGRVNIVFSRNKKLNIKGATVISSEKELFAELQQYETKNVYVIGGEQIFKLLLPYCEYANITKLDYSYEADAFFPNLDKLENWLLVKESDEQTYFSIEYYNMIYKNIKPLQLCVEG